MSSNINRSRSAQNILQDTIKKYEEASTYVKENYHPIWRKCFKAYNSIRYMPGYDGVASEFNPETFSVVESVKAAIIGGKPKFQYLPLREDQEEETDILEAMVDNYWSWNRMTDKVANWVGDSIKYGNGIFGVSWNYKKAKIVIENVPLMDFFFSPTAVHMGDPDLNGYATYAGHRYLTDLETLKAEKKIDPKTGKLVPMYSNLDKIEGKGNIDHDTDKEIKERLLGSTLGKNATDKQIEIIVLYTKKHKIMIANRNTIIYYDENPYHRKVGTSVDLVVEIDGKEVVTPVELPEIEGFLPYVILRNYIDPSLFLARGDIENILAPQEALNDTGSQKRDNLNYAINNMWQIDPRFQNMASEIENIPGGIVPLPAGALTALPKQDISNAADVEISRQQQLIRSVTGADAAVQGVQQKFSRTTATEINAQLQQATTRFTTKMQSLEDGGFAQLGAIMYKMIQIFVDKKTAVRIVGEKGLEWKNYIPGQYVGEYEPRVVLEATAKAEKMERSNTAMTAFQIGSGNPMVNQQVLLREVFKEILDIPKDKIDELLTPPAPAVMAPDGSPVDPTLTQGEAEVTPGGMDYMINGGGGSPGRQEQFGKQGGGGAGSASNNIEKPKHNQPSTPLR